MGKELYRLKLKSLSYVSSVDTPAQETATARLIKRKGGSQINATARVAKLSDELGLVFGWALTTKADGVEYYDLQGDAIQEDDLIRIAAEWMSSGGAADTMHDREQDGRAVFAMPMTTEVAKAVYGDDIGGDLGTYGLLVAIKPSAEDFAKFKSGELTGFSIDGTGVREPVQARKDLAGARTKLQAAIARHERHMDGSEETSDESQMRMMNEMKAALAELTDVTEARKSSDKRYFTDEVLGHQHEVNVFNGGDPWMTDATAEGGQSPHRHTVSRGPDGTLTVLADSGHTHTLTEWPRVVVVAEGTTVISDDVTARASGESPQSKSALNVNTVSKETTVNELDELKALKAKLEAKIAELEAANTELKATAELTDGEKAHLSSLSASEQKRFVALAKSARIAEVEKANEVEHTCIDGTVIRKSDGPTALKFAKLADDALRTAQAEKSMRETVELTKRATETIGKLAGKSQVHVALLKAAESIEGEIEVDGKKLKIADEVVKTLKAANDAMTERAKAKGFGGSQDEQPDGPQAELDALAKKHAEIHKCDDRTARLAVLKTEDGRRLYGEVEDLRKRKALGIQN